MYLIFSARTSLFERHFTADSLCNCYSLYLVSRRSTDARPSYDLSHGANLSITPNSYIDTH